ncbi:MAG: hypothetical protein WC568_05665 [Candidatus Methanoperedens sp.]
MLDQAEIHRMAQSEDAYWREGAAYQLFFHYKELPDKEQAWKDLCRLINDKINRVRWSATEALGVAFPYIPDKLQAWDNLHRLTSDVEYIVRFFAAEAVGVAFVYISDKKQAWDDLYRLTLDENRIVRPTAFFSLGRASIFKATNAENKEKFKKDMEEAISYFEKSLINIIFQYPAKFCLPFYRSFYTLTFKTENVDTEVEEYLAEARNAVKGSESKEKLLEAVENLGNALKEVRNLRNKDFNAVKSDLNAYRRYLERAADLLVDTEEKAPGATKMIRRGLPIIDQKIKEIIAEIQENAKALCKQTKDTPLEDLGKEVIRVSQAFPQIRDPIGLEKGFINLWTALSSICAKMPEEERGEACKLLKKAGDEPYIEDKLPLINMVLSKISSQISATKNIETVEKKLDEIMVSLKPGIREELVISVGVDFGGTGAQHVITIPLQEISYPDLKKDLEKVKGRSFLKLSSLPSKLAEKVKSYITQNKKEEL